jgi:2-keto-3-deoxy-L-rhamnonate aldolase RhmA
MMEGLEVAFIRPMDLSVDFGVSGELEHPEVLAHIRRTDGSTYEQLIESAVKGKTIGRT